MSPKYENELPSNKQQKILNIKKKMFTQVDKVSNIISSEHGVIRIRTLESAPNYVLYKLTLSSTGVWKDPIQE